MMFVSPYSVTSPHVGSWLKCVETWVGPEAGPHLVSHPDVDKVSFCFSISLFFSFSLDVLHCNPLYINRQRLQGVVLQEAKS